MKKLFCSAIYIFLVLIPGYGQDKLYSINGWNLDSDLKEYKISLTNKNLGLVLDKIQLQVIHEGVLKNLTGWQIENSGDNLIIRSDKPVKIVWEFKISANEITVHSSVNNTFITAVAPAPLNRFPSRIADPANILSKETSESNDYTGVAQTEKYYIPRENPHVMYLSLGAIDSHNLHSLFDKQTNTVIQFSPETQLTRLSDDQSFVRVTVPLPGEKSFLTLIPDYYTNVLGMPSYVPYDDTYHKTAPTGWNHWLAFFRQVTEKDIVDHADYISNNLIQYGMLHCQLDDGYDHVNHRLWVKNWDSVTFPHGPEWLAKYIKSKGLIPGLWTVPYCYSVNDANPDWFLRNNEGKILMDYQGGGELDFTRPDVINDYWIPLWKEFKRQGWEYYKFDMGNTSFMWYTYQHNFFDKTITSYEAARKTMTIWRDIMGPEIWHTNHPDIDGGRTGFIDVAGCGKDPGVGWERMNNFLEVISNNAFQNHILWYSDPDCMVIRGKPTRADAATKSKVKTNFLTLEEARTCASLLSLSGMQYLSGDDLLNLEEERLNLIRKTIPTMPIFPVDLFARGRDRNRYPEILDLKVNQKSGVYDVVAVTNWQNESISRSISFTKELSLDADQTYIVFDFWQEQMTGLFNKDFLVEIPAHGTRVFFIRKQTQQPQLLGTNRHISGAFGIKNNVWSNSKMTLTGISETVPGVKYSLYFYIPENVVLNKVDINAKDITQKLQTNGMLEVSFTGQKNEVVWNLKFAKK